VKCGGGKKEDYALPMHGTVAGHENVAMEMSVSLSRAGWEGAHVLHNVTWIKPLTTNPFKDKNICSYHDGKTKTTN